MTEQNKEDLTSLRNELNRLDKEKEEVFSISNGNRKQINDLRLKVKSIKKERNILTDSVKKLKAERDNLNKSLKEKIEAFKKIAPPKKEEKGPKINVAFIKKEIKDMEYMVETSGLSFDKEQKLMKIINQKKKQIAGSSDSGMSEEARNLSKEIDEIRKKADDAHKTMRKNADESQKKHEEVIKLSNELNALEKNQKEVETKIFDYKSKINGINNNLGTKLEEAIQHKREEKPKRRREEQKQHGPRVNIEEMQHKAEEKLKKGQKLTTQDLLAFQDKK